MVKVIHSSLLLSLLIHKAYNRAKAEDLDSAKLSSEGDRNLALLDAYPDRQAVRKCSRQKWVYCIRKNTKENQQTPPY